MASNRRDTFFLLAGDILLLVLSLWFALAARNLALPSWSYYLEHVSAFMPAFLISLLVFYIAGLYERQARLVKRVLGLRILGAQLANTVIAAVLFFMLPFDIAPKTILALYLAISVALISLWRFFVAPSLRLAGRQRALLIGSGALVEEVFENVNNEPKYYIEFVEHIDPGTLPPGELLARVRKARDQGVELVVIDTRHEAVREELSSLYDLMISGVSFVEFASFFEGLFDRVPLEHVDHAWILECLPKQNIVYSGAKRLIDATGALAGLVLAAPFVAVAAVLLWLERGEPFVFHERIGEGGRRFRIVKLRSMLMNDHGDPALQQENRVTKLGKFLRKTRIDELPQLWNILKGELSFIGPRPELPSIAAVYEREIPYYDVRHLVAPGLSGWAQIFDYDAPRGAADIERTKRKLSLDLYYLKHRSFGLDMTIALKTLRALASFSGT